MKLYELSEQYNQLIEMMDQTDDLETIKDTLDSIEEAFDAKVESIVKLIRSKTAESEVVKQEADRLTKRYQKLNKDVEWLTNYVKAEMERVNKEKIKSSYFNITLYDSNPSVHVLDETIVPKQYIITETVSRIDKRTLCELLKSGKQIPGVELIRKKALRIN